jgi:transposase-like protein
LTLSWLRFIICLIFLLKTEKGCRYEKGSIIIFESNRLKWIIIGATEDGVKELVAIEDDFRESEMSWTQLLIDLKGRGLEIAPQLAV